MTRFEERRVKQKQTKKKTPEKCAVSMAAVVAKGNCLALYLVVAIMEEILAVVYKGLGELFQRSGDEVHSVKSGDFWSEQRGPPTNGQILAVHAVLSSVFTDPV